MRRTYCFALVVIFSIIGITLLPAFALKSFCILLLSALLFIVFSIAIKQSFIKYLCITLFSLLIPIAILDAYSTLSHVQQKTIGGKIFDEDVNAGYVLTPSKTTTAKFLLDDETIYDVTYTVDDEGHRVTPKNPDAKIAVLLFGGSFTFGQGIEDNETFAHKLAEQLGSDYQVINYGVPGYGPHQMLAEIEVGLPEYKKYSTILAYYTYISTHEIRAAGGKTWASKAPRYMLEDGKLTRKGTFQDNPPFFWTKGFWTKIPPNSFFEGIKSALIPHLLPYNTTEKRMELTEAIVEKSANEIHKNTAHSKFTILAWPPYAMDKFSPKWQKESAIEIVDVSKWLPNSNQDMEKYRLKDLHPNALAADLVAKQLTELVKKDAKNLVK